MSKQPNNGHIGAVPCYFGSHDSKEGWIMLRRSVVGLVACAAAGVSAIPASANDISSPPITLNSKVLNLRCSADVAGDGPWTYALSYRIDFNDSTVNGEKLKIDRIDLNVPRVSENLVIDPIGAKGPMLRWHRAADASVPAAYYSMDLLHGRLDVTFDDDGRGAKRFFQLRCTNRLLKLSA
jgi:hypothetical protein